MTAATQTQTEDASIAENEEAHELIKTIVTNMTAAEIRAWMSENGVTRTRAARKKESVTEAYEQAPWLVSETADRLRTRFHVVCGHCDNLDEEHVDEDDAVEAAKAHKSENPTHFPRAIDTEEEENIYG